MSTRARQYDALVLRREQLSPHLVRLSLTRPDGYESTGVPDEWVGLVVPGQYQSRYYTVRACDPDELVLDVVIHEAGLVTEWVVSGCPGAAVTITDPKGSFAMPEDAGWLMLVGDLTAYPAMARIAETVEVPTRVWAESSDRLPDYLPDRADVTWLGPPDGGSRLADVVEGLDWPDGPGYFWMAGESAQMRAIRRYLMRVRMLPATAYDVMGYWRVSGQHSSRAVDPGPIWSAGKAAGKSDEEIWADYDKASTTR